MKKPDKTDNPGAQGLCAINVPAELMDRLRKEAEEECRSPERQLECLLKRHYGVGLCGYHASANDLVVNDRYKMPDPNPWTFTQEGDHTTARCLT